jgi:hypothetical protein
LQTHLQIRRSSKTSSAGVARTEQILKATVRRDVDIVRGRVCSGKGPPARGVDEVNLACEALLALLNDDPRLPFPVHVLTDETRDLGRNDIVEMIVAAVQKCRLVPCFSSSNVSANKWGSMFKAMNGQCAGFLIHNIAGQVAQMTYKRCACVLPWPG